MRTKTGDVTLNTWTVRVDGRDVTDVELDEADVSAVRQLVAEVTGQRVSLVCTANSRGILLRLLAEAGR